MDNEYGYCRLCAENKPCDKLLDLLTDELKRREIVDKLLRLNASAEDLFLDQVLPKTVCFVCVSALNQAFEFVLGIEQAQTVLNDLILEQKIKKEAECDITSDPEYVFENYEELDDLPDVKEEQDDRKPVMPDIEVKKRKRTVNKRSSLDSIPLSQLKMTWKDYSWLCAHCETQFVNIDELQSHSMQYHNCCNAYKCSDCNIRKLKLESFILHVRRHRKYLKLSCYKCFARFQTPHLCNTHKGTHIIGAHICSGCNSGFDSLEELERHTNLYNKDRKLRPIPLIQQLNETLTCLFCQKNFKTKGSLSAHLLIHTDRKRDHTCDKCGKCFLNKQNLIGHMLLHDDARPYVCEICKFAFKTPQMLRSHVGVHGGAKPFACDQCGRCFRLQKQLNSHLIIHTDRYPYTCTYCNKGFRFKTILNQHLRQHTGIKPYNCDICQRDFTNWPNYNKHMKRRHGMDMAKKKHTPEGLFPLNPVTGEIIVYPEAHNMEAWKKKVMTPKRVGRPTTTSIKMELEVKDNLTEDTQVKTNVVQN